MPCARTGLPFLAAACLAAALALWPSPRAAAGQAPPPPAIPVPPSVAPPPEEAPASGPASEPDGGAGLADPEAEDGQALAEGAGGREALPAIEGEQPAQTVPQMAAPFRLANRPAEVRLRDGRVLRGIIRAQGDRGLWLVEEPPGPDRDECRDIWVPAASLRSAREIAPEKPSASVPPRPGPGTPAQAAATPGYLRWSRTIARPAAADLPAPGGAAPEAGPADAVETAEVAVFPKFWIEYSYGQWVVTRVEWP